MYSPFISGEKIDLCPVSKDYMEILQKGYNDPDVRDAMFMYFPLTEKDTENKIEAMLKDEKAGKKRLFSLKRSFK